MMRPTCMYAMLYVCIVPCCDPQLQFAIPPVLCCAVLCAPRLQYDAVGWFLGGFNATHNGTFLRAVLAQPDSACGPLDTAAMLGPAGGSSLAGMVSGTPPCCLDAGRGEGLEGQCGSQLLLVCGPADILPASPDPSLRPCRTCQHL